jgi:hypothetical protein
MKIKDNIGCLFIIGLAIGCIILSIAITKAIVNADIPEWLKFWLLT